MSDTMSVVEDTFEEAYVIEEVKKSSRSRFEEKLRRFAKDRYDKYQSANDPRLRLRYSKELNRLRQGLLYLEQKRLKRARLAARNRFRGMLPLQKARVAENYMRMGIHMDAAKRFRDELDYTAHKQGATMEAVNKEIDSRYDKDAEVKRKLAEQELPVEYDMSASDYTKIREQSKDGREANRGKGLERRIDEEQN